VNTSAIPLHLGPGESGGEHTSPQLLSDPVGYLASGYRSLGPVFRTRYRGDDWVTIAGIEANDFFWQNLSNWSYAQAGPGFTDVFGPTYVTQLDGAPHLRKRRLLKAAFSAEAVGRFVRTMADKAAEFLGNRGSWGDDANEWIPALLLTLNKATVVQTELSDEEMRDAIALEGEIIYGVSVSAAPAEHFARPGYAERKARVFGCVDRVLRARSEGLRAPDNLQGLIEQDPGNLAPLSGEELRNDAYMLLVAGIHNTTRLLTRILERISLDPAWVAELRAELAGYTHESLCRGMGAFPKLRATILEGERLHPGATFLKRRPVRDLEFAGRTIPAGTPVLQAHTLPQFLREFYEDPLAFRPRRWLEGPPPDRKALVDFGGGSHICIGMNLTRIHSPIVLAEILRNYDWEHGYTPSFALKVDPGASQKEPNEPVALRRRA
jgi:cytochrome P450